MFEMYRIGANTPVKLDNPLDNLPVYQKYRYAAHLVADTPNVINSARWLSNLLTREKKRSFRSYYMSSCKG